MEHVVRVAKAPGRGRGVFAMRAIEPGEVIEVCPVVPLSRACGLSMPQSFEDYIYHWDGDNEAAAFAAAGGYGSFYNHSSQPNAGLEYDFEDNELTFRALRPIAAGEEVRFDYGDIWFAES